MPRNVYSEINLHMTWHTKNNAPVLVDHVENRVDHYLEHRALQTPGVFVHAVDGVADHVHMVITVPPTLLISDWIGQLKGSSSHHVNHGISNRKVLDWQVGYGEFRNEGPALDRSLRQEPEATSCRGNDA
ncbi:MAG TPA: IS200/IS605 family transposase [Phycisphaerae bacterium]|jgi:REP element-mobilizing transposase RayT